MAIKLDKIQEEKHKELIALVNPLLEHLRANNYTFLFVAGKDELCSRYMEGTHTDLHGILNGLAKTHKGFCDVILEITR